MDIRVRGLRSQPESRAFHVSDRLSAWPTLFLPPPSTPTSLRPPGRMRISPAISSRPSPGRGAQIIEPRQ